MSRAWKKVWGEAVPEDGHLREVFRNKEVQRPSGRKWPTTGETVRGPPKAESQAAGAGLPENSSTRWLGGRAGSPGKTLHFVVAAVRSRC